MVRKIAKAAMRLAFKMKNGKIRKAIVKALSRFA